MAMPRSAAATMINVSLAFLKRIRIATVDNAIPIDVRSLSVFLARISTAPAIAPTAAAVIPSTMAFIEGCFPYFLK